MARSKMDGLMTAEEIAKTFGDRTVIDLETRQAQIPDELRLARLDIVDGAIEMQILLDDWEEDLLRESRENSDKIREIRKARSETIGIKIR